MKIFDRREIWSRIVEALGTDSASEIGRKLGRSKQTVWGWKNSIDPPIEALIKIAGLSGATLDWLIKGEGETPSILKVAETAPAYESRSHANLETEAEPKFLRVPLLHDRIAAGEALTVEESEYEEIAFKSTSLKRVRHPRCFRLGPREESMAPTIRPNDLLLIDMKEGPFDKVQSGRIFVVRIDDGLAVKRVELQEDQLLIISDNPDKKQYPTKALRGKAADRAIVGEVVWIGRYVEDNK